jgi:hypothetical protein
VLLIGSSVTQEPPAQSPNSGGIRSNQQLQVSTDIRRSTSSGTGKGNSIVQIIIPTLVRSC